MKKAIILSRDVAIESIAERILSNPMEYNLHDYVYEYFENKDREFLQDQHNKMFEIEVTITYTWEEVKEQAIKFIIGRGIVSSHAIDVLLRYTEFHDVPTFVGFLNELLEDINLKICVLKNETKSDKYYIVNTD